MARFRSRLTARVLPVVFIGFAASTAVAVTSAAQAQKLAVVDKGRDVTANAASLVDGQTRSAQQAAISLAAVASGFSGTDRTVLRSEVRELARATVGVSDAYVLYARGRAPGPDAAWAGQPGMTETGRFSLCYLRHGFSDPELLAYDDPTTDAAVTQPFWTGPASTGRLTTTEPYVDPGSHVLMTSFTAAITDAQGRFAGVAGVDVPLGDLSQQIAATRVGQGGYAVLLSQQGTVLAVPQAKVGSSSVVGAKSLRDAVTGPSAATAQTLMQRVSSSSTGSLTSRDPFGSEPALITWTQVPSTRWTLLTIIPSAEVEAPVVALQNKLMLTALGVLLAVAAALVFASARLTRRLPVVRDAALRIAEGRLDVDLPDAQDDELGEVSTAFAAIVTYLRGAHEQESRFAQVQALADADPLTGIPNRRRFFELAEPRVAGAREQGLPLAALMLDIDHFKDVNDTYGHATGDDVIRVVSDRLAAALRGGDVLGRYGGEEFAVVLSGAAGAAEIPERLRACVADLPVPTRSGELRITVSVGAAQLTSLDNSAAALLARADAALYRAKQAGRNRVISQAAEWSAGSTRLG